MLFVHADAVLGDSMPATDASVAESSIAARLKNDPKTDGKRCAFCWRGKKSSLGQGILVRCEPTSGFNPFRKSLKGRQSSSEQDTSKRKSRRYAEFYFFNT